MIIRGPPRRMAATEIFSPISRNGRTSNSRFRSTGDGTTCAPEYHQHHPPAAAAAASSHTRTSMNRGPELEGGSCWPHPPPHPTPFYK